MKEHSTGQSKMLLSFFSAHQPGVALLNASFWWDWECPRNGLALANWPFLPIWTWHSSRAEKGKELIFLTIFISLTMIPLGRKSAALSRLMSFWCKSGFVVQGGIGSTWQAVSLARSRALSCGITSNFGRLLQAVFIKAGFKGSQKDVEEAPCLITFPRHTVSGIPNPTPIRDCFGGPICHMQTMNHSLQLCFLRLQSHVAQKTRSRPKGFNHIHAVQSLLPWSLRAHSFYSILGCSLLYQSQMGNLSSPVSHMNAIYHLPAFEINLLAAQLPTLCPWLPPICVQYEGCSLERGLSISWWLHVLPGTMALRSVADLWVGGERAAVSYPHAPGGSAHAVSHHRKAAAFCLAEKCVWISVILSLEQGL